MGVCCGSSCAGCFVVVGALDEVLGINLGGRSTKGDEEAAEEDPNVALGCVGVADANLNADGRRIGRC